MRQLSVTRALSLLATVCLSFLATAVTAQDRPRVVAVNYTLQYLAERLLGDTADVTFPVPEGVDPSFWRPSIADISEIQSADLILLNGAGFATWVDRVSLPRSRLANTSAALVDRYIITETITHSHGDGGEHSHEGLASYTWLDPTMAMAQADAIAQAIARRNLAPADEVGARLVSLRSDLEALDAEASAALLPLKAIGIVVTHPRYQYLARRYGLTVASLEWEAGAVPSPEERADLRDLVSETGARILIWEKEPQGDGRSAVESIGVRSVVFETLAHAPPSGDFLTAFRAGVSALAEAAGTITGN